MPQAKPHAKKYELRSIAGERGKTRRTKPYKVLWEDRTTTWEPAADIDAAADAIKAWTKLSPDSQEMVMNMNDEELAERFFRDVEVGVPISHILGEDADICVVQDLYECKYSSMIQQLCDAAAAQFPGMCTQ